MAGSGVATAGVLTELPQALLDVYSLDILHEAQGIMRFEDFAVRKQDLMASPGENLKFTIYDDLATQGGTIDEHTSLSAQAMTASQKTIQVTEYGNAVNVSEKLLRLSYDDLMAETATLLGRDYAVARDVALRDALSADLTHDLFYNAGFTGANLASVALKFDTEIVREGVKKLQIENAPKFNGDFYVCFLHPHQATELRRDTEWVSANNYANTRNLFSGELGRWEDVVFISTTHAKNGEYAGVGLTASLTGSGANAKNVYEALLFADQCLYVADALPVELRDNGVEDFGRTRGLAWYSIFGTKALMGNYGVKMYTL
jgi:N4-gp56 family major capsid protein